MKTHFDWQTEESEQQGKAELADDVPPSRRKLGCLTLTLIVAAIVIISFAWMLNKTQSEAIENVSKDVLLAFELQQQAVEEGDEELFLAMLSSSDLAWKRDQEQLFAANLFNDRSLIGFVGDGKTPTQPALDLSPDLEEVDVSYVQDYTAVTDSVNQAHIELLHHRVYRLEDGRWQHSPSAPSFWGPWSEIEGAYVSITYPERDADFAPRLLSLIDDHLKDLCSGLGEGNHFGQVFCEGDNPWNIRLTAEAGKLLDFSGRDVAQSPGFDFEIPTPTLVGVPLNEEALDLYLEFYTKSVLQKMETALLTTALFPNQHIYALCFKHPLSGRNLYRYDWRLRSWHPVLPAQTYHYLSSLPDDSAIMLAEGDTITMMYANTDSDPVDHRAVWQGDVPLLGLKILLGWIETANDPYFLLMERSSGEVLPDYSALDLQVCDEQNCVMEELPGFPIPSVISDASLFVEGSNIVLGTGARVTLQPVGRGFNPFWINGETFGFVRFEGDVESGITTQVVLGDLGGSEQRELIDGNDLSDEAALPLDSMLYVHEVVLNPADPDMLLISSTGIHGYSGNYFIFSLDVSEGLHQPAEHALKLEVARSGSLAGVPGVLSPTGFPSLLVSENGRWLAVTELNSQDKATWTILIHDLQTGTTSEVSNNVPAMPGNFPLLDWSGDRQWLLIGDRDSLHLISPEHTYEELIGHDFDACSHIVWAD